MCKLNVVILITTLLSIPLSNIAVAVKARAPPLPVQIGPKGVDAHDMTTCAEFSKYARFNPYTVLEDKWFAFYYWAPKIDKIIIQFLAPTRKEIGWLRQHMDNQVMPPVNWTARLLLMSDQVDKQTHLLVETGDRGQYLLYMIIRTKDGAKLEPVEVRFKQTSDNRYLGFMKCEEDILYVLSRIDDIPAKKKIQDAAATMGYRARGGKSYLYQGHEWMPIPEADDRKYWLPREYSKRNAFDFFDD